MLRILRLRLGQWNGLLDDHCRGRGIGLGRWRVNDATVLDLLHQGDDKDEHHDVEQ